MSYLAHERDVAVRAVLAASKVTQKVFQKLADKQSNAGVITKVDASPVTVADYASQALINHLLGLEFPLIPIVGEEDTKSLRNQEGDELRVRILELVNDVLGEGRKISEDQMLAAIDRGNHPGGSCGLFWTLDPIDGTKGFLRGGQYAICLALIVNGQVELGIMGCPNLPDSLKTPSEDRGVVFVATKNGGAFKRAITSNELVPIKVSDLQELHGSAFLESVESGHSSHDQSSLIARQLNITQAPIRMDSQCKYGCLSRGDAEIYLRLPVRDDYEENIWDHASGYLLVTEAGGKVSDIHGKELDFGAGRTLRNNKGVIATNGHVHDKVLAVVKNVVSST